jgi:hypothetical protein
MLYGNELNYTHGLLYVIGKDEDIIKFGKYHIVIAQLKDNFYQSKKLIKQLILSDTENEPELTKQQMHTVDLTVEWLFENGFLQKKVIALDYQKRKPLYEIDIKGGLKSGDRNCSRIEPLIRRIGLKAGRGEANYRFFDRYAAIAPSECEPMIIGVYKPAFFPACTSLKINQQVQANEHLRQAQFETRIADFENQLER